MKGSNSHISLEDFHRYLNNRMTDAERNAFERKLQKYPFEAEALEGFRQISTTDLNKDLQELSRKIPTKKNRSNIRYWAVAASFLVLISIGVLLFRITESPMAPQVAESKGSLKEELKTTLPEPLKPEQKAIETIENKSSAKKNTLQQLSSKAQADQVISISEKAEESPEQAEVARNANPVPTSEMIVVEETMAPSSKNEISVQEPTSIQQSVNAVAAKLKQAPPMVESARNKKKTGTKKTIWIKGRVVSDDDQQPLPGVSIVEKGTSNGTVSDQKGNFSLHLTNSNDSILMANFVGMEEKEIHLKGDSNVVFSLVPSPLALDETVVVAYGVNHETQDMESIKPACPQIGMSNFRKYLNDKAVLPEDYKDSKVVVRIKLKIGAQGNILSVENMNHADAPVYENAREMLINGSVWNPKTVNGNPVESEITLRIVFRKVK